jgi:hypothetical protein
MLIKQGTMQELIDTILHYLDVCNRIHPRYSLVISVIKGEPEFSVMEDDEILVKDNDLERIASWLKVYVSWADGG